MLCRCGAENSSHSRRCPRCRRLLLWGIPLGQLLGDAAGGLLLVAAVALVFLFDRRGTLAPPVAAACAGRCRWSHGRRLPSRRNRGRCAWRSRRRKYDDMGQLLGTLGAEVPLHPAAPPTTCWSAERSAGVRRGLRHLRRRPARAGSAQQVGPGAQRDSAGIVPAPARTSVRRLRTAWLRGYVAGGRDAVRLPIGSITCWRLAFPRVHRRDEFRRGSRPQRVAAEVVDEALRRQLGSPDRCSASTSPAWAPRRLPGRQGHRRSCGARTAIENRPGSEPSPLLVQFPFGDGTRDLHLVPQRGPEQRPGAESAAEPGVQDRHGTQRHGRQADAAARAGSRPASGACSRASCRSRRSAQTYDCRGGHELRFVLGFENRGAELRLEVEAPDGQVLEER